MDQQLETRYSAETIASRVNDVARAIDSEFAGQSLVLVSILKGASVFLADLARRLSLPVSCEYISVRRAGHPEKILQIDFSTWFDIAGRPVVLLKDVVNTGVIETYLMTHLRDRGASQIKLAAIIDKAGDRTTDLVVEHPLFSAAKGHFAGYGMEYRGRYANLPYIAEVQGPLDGAPEQ
ncbi:MAG TPA: phosphoribosyltransferase family protein [Thermoanaerobaculia bacterium]|nr:phosphoribosyltransferase family protein [Thermoanaerobaculia bacterium]